MRFNKQTGGAGFRPGEDGRQDKELPEMKKAVVALLHGGYWMIYLLLLALILGVVCIQTRKTSFDLPALFPLLVLCVAPNFISFYSFYLWLFPKFLARRKIPALVVCGVLVCFAAALSGVFLALVFFGFAQAIFADGREFLLLTASLFVLAAIHGAVALVIRGFLVWFDEIKLKEELRRKNYETELALIKSQIDPHFLFNTLNNIDVLIGKDARLGSAYLNKLSGILRYMVYETGAERIALAREIAYLEKYIELQKIRSINPDYVNFLIDGEAGNLTVAPMLFFPFVENAFKHTENKKNAHSIRIKLLIEGTRLVFECENSYQANGSRSQSFGGLGNELIKKRLELAYPEKHRLEINDAAGVYQVKLTLVEN